MTGKQPDNRSAFGSVLESLLEDRGETHTSIAPKLKVSRPYVCKALTNRVSVSAGWVNMVADVLAVTPRERVKLHRAAARDNGVILDLSENQSPKK